MDDNTKYLLDNMELCFIDTETTGLYPAYGDRICEIGLIVADERFDTLDRFGSLVNPLREISPEAQMVNRIDQQDLESAPLFADVAERVLELINGRLLVGHNVMFDYGFLKNEFRLAGIDFPRINLLDTRDVARRLVKTDSLGLSTLIAMFGISIENRHRAMGDCMGTFQLMKHLAALNREKHDADIAQTIQKFAFEPEETLEKLPLWIKESLDSQREIEIEYCDRRNVASRRIILPLAAFSDRGKIYLEAICRKKNAKRTFLIDRIKKVHYPE